MNYYSTNIFNYLKVNALLCDNKNSHKSLNPNLMIHPFVIFYGKSSGTPYYFFLSSIQSNYAYRQHLLQSPLSEVNFHKYLSGMSEER